MMNDDCNDFDCIEQLFAIVEKSADSVLNPNEVNKTIELINENKTEAGVDSLSTKHDGTALHVLICGMTKKGYQQQFQLVECLLSNKANPLLKDNDDEFPLLAIFKNNCLDIKQKVATYFLMLSYHQNYKDNLCGLTNDSSSMESLQGAMRQAGLDKVTVSNCIKALRNPSDLEKIKGTVNCNLSNMLNMQGVGKTIESGGGNHAGVINYFERDCGVDINKKYPWAGRTVAMVSVFRALDDLSALEAVKLHIANEAQINIVDDKEENLLFYAARKGFTGTTLFFLGKDIDFKQKNNGGNTFLHILATEKDSSSSNGNRINTLNEVLNFGTKNQRNDGALKKRLAIYALLKEVNNEGNNCLHVAAQEGNENFWRCVLNERGNTIKESQHYKAIVYQMLFCENHDGKMPCALINDNKLKKDVSSYMKKLSKEMRRISKGQANMNTFFPQPKKMQHSYFGESSIIKKIKMCGKAKMEDDKAAQNILYNHIVRLQNDQGADIDEADNYCNTPLFYLIQYRFNQVITKLLQGGYKINLIHKNKEGQNILHIAAKHNKKFMNTIVSLYSKQPGTRDVIKKMFDSKDNNGKTPQDYLNEKEGQTMVCNL